MIAATGKAKEYWHLNGSHSIKTLLCAETSSTSLPTFEISLNFLTLPAPGAGDIVEFILLYGGLHMGRKPPKLKFFSSLILSLDGSMYEFHAQAVLPQVK
jgi:hypothetical protein